MLASVAIKQANYNAAKDYTQRLHELSVQTGDMSASAFQLLGMIAAHCGRLHTQEQSISTTRFSSIETLNDVGGQAQIHTNIGNTHYLAGGKTYAFEAYHHALEIQRTLNNRPSIALITSNIGAILTDYALYDDARRYLEESLDILRSINNNISISNALSHLAKLYYETGDYGKAAEICQSLSFA